MAVQKLGWELPKSGGHCLLGTRENRIPKIKKLHGVSTFSQVRELMFSSSPFIFTWLLTVQEPFVHIPSRPGKGTEAMTWVFPGVLCLCTRKGSCLDNCRSLVHLWYLMYQNSTLVVSSGALLSIAVQRAHFLHDLSLLREQLWQNIFKDSNWL